MKKHFKKKGKTQTALRIAHLFVFYYYIWIIGAIILSALLGYVILIHPQQRALVEKITDEKNRIAKEVDTKGYISDNLRESLKKFANIEKQDMDKLIGIVPALDQQGHILSVINGIAQEEGIHLVRLELSKSIPLDTYWSSRSLFTAIPVVAVPVHVEFSGTSFNYETIKNLLHALHTKHRIFALREVKITGSAATGAETDIGSFSLDMDIFFRDQKDDIHMAPLE